MNRYKLMYKIASGDKRVDLLRRMVGMHKQAQGASSTNTNSAIAGLSNRKNQQGTAGGQGGKTNPLVSGTGGNAGTNTGANASGTAGLQAAEAERRAREQADKLLQEQRNTDNLLSKYQTNYFKQLQTPAPNKGWAGAGKGIATVGGASLLGTLPISFGYGSVPTFIKNPPRAAGVTTGTAPAVVPEYDKVNWGKFIRDNKLTVPKGVKFPDHYTPKVDANGNQVFTRPVDPATGKELEVVTGTTPEFTQKERFKMSGKEGLKDILKFGLPASAVAGTVGGLYEGFSTDQAAKDTADYEAAKDYYDALKLTNRFDESNPDHISLRALVEGHQ